MRSCLCLFGLLLVGCLLPLSLQAAPEAAPGPTLQAVEKRLQGLETADLASETRQSLRETYGKTQAALQAADDFAARAASLNEIAKAAPKERDRLKTQIAAGVTGVFPVIGSGTPISFLEQSLDRVTAELATLREKQASSAAEIERMMTRRKDVPRMLAEARQRSENLSEGLRSMGQPGTDRDEARTWLAEAQQAQALAEIRLLEGEMAQFDLLLDLEKLRRDLLLNKIMAAEVDERTYRRLVDDRRRQEAEAAANKARETVRDLGAEFPFLRGMAEENAGWAEQRRALTLQMEAITRESASYTQTLARLQDEHRSIRDKIQAIGFSDAIGILLRVKRADLPSLSGFQETLEQRQKDIALTQLRLIELEENLGPLRDIETRTGEVLAREASGLAPDRRRVLETKVKEVLRQRRDFLENLQRDLSSLFSRLVDLDTLARQIVGKSREFAAYIDERILWVRSCQPLGPSDLGRSIRALPWLFSPARWLEAGSAFLAGLLSHVLLVTFLFVAWGALLAARPRFTARLAEIANLVQRAATDRFVLTLEAVALTAVWAVPWPLMLWILGNVLGAASDGGEFAQVLGDRLAWLAPPLWGLEFFRQIFLPNGLAEVHCHWHLGETQALLRGQARLLGWLVLPLVLMFQVVRDLAPDPVQVSLGRTLFLAVLLVTAWLLDPLTRPAGPVMEKVGGYSRSQILYRIRHPLFGLTVLFPLALVAACGFGYFYTAQQLWAKAALSLALVLAGLLVYSLTWRALHVQRRSLALRKSQVMRAVQEDAVRPETPAGEAGPTQPHVDPSIFTISAQTEKLLFVVLAVTLIIGLFHVWSEVFPALRIFDQVKLWSTETRVSEAVTAPDGAVRHEWVEKTVSITLFDLLIAGLIIFLTVSASRNLPGFLEFAVLQRLELDAGMKFAVRALSSYLIGVIGFVLVFETIGLGWDKIQWLAAGVSVGLGFGLQEIFANFVSGLILLFERPIRVGDTVTVGEVTGTVTRIQIRSTTLLNFDRKEVIIPNKDLITGSLTNWTLTDSVQRLVFRVGTAYGSDPEKVKTILLEVARGHPRVLPDPAPQALFLGFGDSCLDFQLRVFIGSLDGYADLQHEINCRVLAALNQAGIEIPFPQRDLHVRHWEGPMPSKPAGNKR